eukprot:s1303_g20.t1
MSDEPLKGGVPSYDGVAEKFPRYKEDALQYMFTLEVHKRYLAGPRLVQGLSGVAKTVVRKRLAVDPQWLAHPRGAYDLLDHLEANLGQPSLLSASQYIHKFFYQLRRKKNETMTEWTNRHSEALWEASRALRRVSKDETSVNTSRGSSGDHSQRATSEASWSERRAPRPTSTLFDDHGRLPEEDWEEHDAEASSQQGWSWKESGWSGWDWKSWRSEEYQPPPSWECEVPDFLPDHLTGFLLLQRSGLDAHERANILSAIKGTFSVSAVEKALKEQWSDEDLLRRDRTQYSAQVTFPEDDDEEVLWAQERAPDPEGAPEAYEAFMADQEVIEQALETIALQKRTLKEARWRQQQVKSGRKFFPARDYGGQQKRGTSASTTGRADGGIKCYRCGGPHSTYNCPVPKKQQANVSEEAEVAFGADEVLSVQHAEEQVFAVTVSEAIRMGKGVIDCGATATLGSVSALEALGVHNVAKFGEDRISIDPAVTPTFKFGNNGTTSCLSTAHVKVDCGQKVGDMSIHVHDLSDQPILISVKALKSLGAVIDFDRDEIIYKNICPHSVVPTERASNGHLLMPLTGNLLEGAKRRKAAFSSLADE